MRSRDDVAAGVAIAGGRILAVSDETTVRKHATPHTQSIDLQGATVLPGFTDVHVHLENHARYDRSLDTLTSREAILERIGDRHARLGPDEWLLWSCSITDRALWPTAAELDRICEGRPALLTVGGASSVLSSAALSHLRRDLDAVGASIETDPDTGEPTGVLRTRGSGSLQYLLPGAPIAGKAQVREGVLRGMRELAAAGVTMIHHVVKERLPIEIYQDLREQRALPVRVGLLLRGYESDIPLDAIVATGFRQGFGGSWLSFQGVKISVDGYFPEGGAAFTDPYASDPGNRGRLRVPREDLFHFVDAANRAGLRIAIHANGDAAIDLALDAYEAALGAFPRGDHRHRIEHAGNLYLTADHVTRMRALDLVAVPNPTFLHRRARHMRTVLGPERAAAPLAVRSLLEGGVRTIAATDYSGLYPPDPLLGIWAMTSRESLDGSVYAPEQAIDAWNALNLYTAEPAWLSFQEHLRGTIATGKLADLVVVSEDPAVVDPHDIAAKCQVLATLVGGRASHASGDLATIPALPGA